MRLRERFAVESLFQSTNKFQHHKHERSETVAVIQKQRQKQASDEQTSNIQK